MRNDTHILCFGELLLRLSAPGATQLFQEPRLEAQFGGAEANVAVALSRLGLKSAMASIVPDDALGDGAIDALRRHGVDVSGIGRSEGRLGLYFLSPGAGLRASAIVYDRMHSAFSLAARDRYDWRALLDGAGWLHLSGITPAIGQELVPVGLDAIAAAQASGARISFDGNFRGTMWQRWCADPGPILSQYAAGADLLFGSHRDIALMIGRTLPADTPHQRRAAAEAAFDAFPRLQTIASTARNIRAADHHVVSARIDTRDAFFETPAMDVTGIVDRIGTGDAFAAGVLARLDDGLEAAATTGLALAALKHATPGDQSLTTARDLAAFSPDAGDVRR